MCAVIGSVIKNPEKRDFDMIRRVFHESRIRGLHATGMSVLFDDKILTFKEPVSADNFVHLDNLEEMVNNDGVLYLIGHCRYSTSDLQYNQPIANVNKSVAHNGVITQELPEKWKDIYGWDMQTKNDSELVLHSSNPLVEFADASLAVCELHLDRKVRVYRNGKRPLYLTSLENGCIITSTADVARRAELDFATAEIPMNTYITFDEHLAMLVEEVKIEKAVDYQHHDIC